MDTGWTFDGGPERPLPSGGEARDDSLRHESALWRWDVRGRPGSHRRPARLRSRTRRAGTFREIAPAKAGRARPRPRTGRWPGRGDLWRDPAVTLGARAGGLGRTHNDAMADRIPEWLPKLAHDLAGWVMQPMVLTLLAGASVLLFVLSLIGLPLVLARMPSDFFSRPERRRLRLDERARPFWFVLLRGMRNALGVVLLALGLLMLIVPGQGLLTIFVALLLIDFPGKYRLQRWVFSRPAVHRPANALRRRFRRPPLELPVRPTTDP